MTVLFADDAAWGGTGEISDEASQYLRAVAQHAEPTVAVVTEQAAHFAAVVVVIDDERRACSTAARTLAALFAPEAFVCVGSEPVTIRQVAMPLVFGAVARLVGRFGTVGGTAGFGGHITEGEVSRGDG